MKKMIDNSSLKLLAMLAMLIDHIAWVSFPLATNMNILSPNWLANSMHIIGRLAFPVFAFCIAEGYRHRCAQVYETIGAAGSYQYHPFLSDGLGYWSWLYHAKYGCYSLFGALCSLLQ